MADYEAIFEAITGDPRYQANLDWGKARRGHPEGTIRSHIVELERNLKAFERRLSKADYWRLKILIHTHDIFKPDAKLGVRITSPYSHSSLARAFLTEFCDDADLLAMVQYHDEPFALWRQFAAHVTFNQERLDSLLSTIQDWNLFLAFCIIDGCTEGKQRDHLYWLFEQVADKVQSQFTAADIR